MSTRNLLIVVSLAAMIAGCASDKRNYSVVVENRSDLPVTVWLTQNQPVSDPHWMAPETMAIASPSMHDPGNRVVVRPGQTASTGMEGKFKNDTDAVLRVYIGERSFDEILAMSRGNPNRFDVMLEPGRNDVVLTQQNGRIIATRGEPTTMPANQ